MGVRHDIQDNHIGDIGSKIGDCGSVCKPFEQKRDVSSRLCERDAFQSLGQVDSKVKT